MKGKIRDVHFLFLSAFIEGAALMAVEILSSKIIAPYYGSSLYVWASILGITMGGLAIGYFLGGILSEKKINSVSRLMWLFIISSFLLFLVPYTSAIIMESTLQMELRSGIFLSCFAFLLPLVICFGIVSPTIIRLITNDTKKIGFSSGIVYTVSTFGGIIFTFLTGFYLISTLGVKGCTNVISAFLLIPPAIHFVKALISRNKKPSLNEN